MAHQEFRIATGVAQSHLVERGIDQPPYLLKVARRRDELQTAQVFPLRHAIDDVGVVNLAVVSRRIEVLDPGVAV